jgi:hypothetical protein
VSLLTSHGWPAATTSVPPVVSSSTGTGVAKPGAAVGHSLDTAGNGIRTVACSTSRQASPDPQWIPR